MREIRTLGLTERGLETSCEAMAQFPTLMPPNINLLLTKNCVEFGVNLRVR